MAKTNYHGMINCQTANECLEMQAKLQVGKQKLFARMCHISAIFHPGAKMIDYADMNDYTLYVESGALFFKEGKTIRYAMKLEWLDMTDEELKKEAIAIATRKSFKIEDKSSIAKDYEVMKSFEEGLTKQRYQLFKQVQRIAEILKLEGTNANLKDDDSFTLEDDGQITFAHYPEHSYDETAFWTLRPEWFDMTDTELRSLKRSLDKKEEEKQGPARIKQLEKKIKEETAELKRLKRKL